MSYKGLIDYTDSERLELTSRVVDAVAIHLGIDIDKIYHDFDNELIEIAETLQYYKK